MFEQEEALDRTRLWVNMKYKSLQRYLTKETNENSKEDNSSLNDFQEPELGSFSKNKFKIKM